MIRRPAPRSSGKQCSTFSLLHVKIEELVNLARYVPRALEHPHADFYIELSYHWSQLGDEEGGVGDVGCGGGGGGGEEGE